jgi:hypothetical protein
MNKPPTKQNKACRAEIYYKACLGHEDDVIEAMGLIARLPNRLAQQLPEAILL